MSESRLVWDTTFHFLFSFGKLASGHDFGFRIGSSARASIPKRPSRQVRKGRRKREWEREMVGMRVGGSCFFVFSFFFLLCVAGGFGLAHSLCLDPGPRAKRLMSQGVSGQPASGNEIPIALTFIMSRRPTMEAGDSIEACQYVPGRGPITKTTTTAAAAAKKNKKSFQYPTMKSVKISIHLVLSKDLSCNQLSDSCT